MADPRDRIHIHSLFVGQPKTMTDRRGTWISAIYRQPVANPVSLLIGGLEGDQVADTEHHGSPDQAVCCHPIEHYAYWNEFFGLTGDRRLVPGSVGENWTLTNANEGDVCVGDVFQVGTARVQITGPRVPCTKQERKTGIPGFLRGVQESMRTGFYLRVLTPGVVQGGDELKLEARPQPDILVRQVMEFGLLRFDPEYAERLLEVEELGSGWKRILRQLLEREKV